eukprot:7893-Heterococcus_DN1.PRE.1
MWAVEAYCSVPVNMKPLLAAPAAIEERCVLYANNLAVLFYFFIFVLYFNIHEGFCVTQQRSLHAKTVLVSAAGRRNYCNLQRKASLCSTCLSGTGIRAHANSSADECIVSAL